MYRYHIFILEKQINKTTNQTSHPATSPLTCNIDLRISTKMGMIMIHLAKLDGYRSTPPFCSPDFIATIWLFNIAMENHQF